MSLNVTLRILWIVLIVAFSFLVINDFFPLSLGILSLSPTHTIVLVMLLFAIPITVLSFFQKKEKKSERVQLKQSIKSSLFSISYLVTLILILHALGGTSQSGISFTNPIFIIVLLIGIVQIRNQIKKLKQMEQES